MKINFFKLHQNNSIQKQKENNFAFNSFAHNSYSELKNDEFKRNQGIINPSFSGKNKLKAYTKLPEIIELKKLKNMPCPYCGKKMVTPDVLNELAKVATDKTPQEYAVAAMEILTPHKEVMFSVAKDVFSMVEKAFAKKTNQSLYEIMRELKIEHLESLNNSQLNIINKIDSEARKLPQRQQNPILNLTEETRWVINENYQDYLFKNESFMNKLTIVMNKIPDCDAKKAISEYCMQLPCSDLNIEAFIAKYGGPIETKMIIIEGREAPKPVTDSDIMNRNIDIAQRFIQESLMSVEHLEAQSSYAPKTVLNQKEEYRNLADAYKHKKFDKHLKEAMKEKLSQQQRDAIKISNKKAKDISSCILAHRFCNTERDSKKLPDFIQEKKALGIDIPKLVNTHFEYIINAIKNKQLSKCNDYPQKVKPTLYEQSEGLIEIKA